LMSNIELRSRRRFLMSEHNPAAKGPSRNGRVYLFH